MKNVITILIDSVFSGCLSTNRTKISSTPYIDTLCQQGIFAPNVYSYGPYTDAATKGLYCSEPTLDNYGYYYGINSSNKNHFQLFKELGYETYGLYYPYYLLSSKVEKDIDHSIYTSGFLYKSVWDGKFVYYSNLIKSRKLTELEYIMLEKCIEMVFDCWSLFYRNIRENPESSLIITRLYSPDKSYSSEQKLMNQIELYRQDKVNYIDQILKAGMNHELAKINEYEFSKHVNKKFLKTVYKDNHSFFKTIDKKNFVQNIKNNHPSVKKTLYQIKQYFVTHDKAELRLFVNYAMCLEAVKLMKYRSLRPEWQLLASLNKQVETVLKVLADRKNDGKPFYISLHALEPHHDISFFSYDSDDENLIREELEYISPLVQGCGKSFSGNLTYQMSLCYVDLCIKRLITGLEKQRNLNNTTIMLVSDHGTSYTYNPLRNYVVNTFHKENYNIPMIIWNVSDKHKNKKFDGFYMSEDIYPTLLDSVDLAIPNDYQGISMLKYPAGRQYVITEYMGPGCPDMIGREVWISIRNQHYVISYKNRIDKLLDIVHPVAFYNLFRDPLETINLCTSFTFFEADKEVHELVNALQKRYESIQKETIKILSNIDSFTVI